MAKQSCRVIALLLFCSSASAQLEGPGLTPGIPDHASTLGLGSGIGVRGWFDGRPGLSANEGLRATSMVLADWHPLSNGLRISGGLAYGPLWSAAAPGHGIDQRLGDPWSAASAIDSRSWIAHGNPYLGLGWGLDSRRSGLYVNADVGLMYNRSGSVAWGCPGGIPSSACPMDLRVDSAALPEDARLSPVMSLGVGLRF